MADPHFDNDSIPVLNGHRETQLWGYCSIWTVRYWSEILERGRDSARERERERQTQKSERQRRRRTEKKKEKKERKIRRCITRN